jgi:potassium-dependent mechanosensitive channel
MHRVSKFLLYAAITILLVGRPGMVPTLSASSPKTAPPKAADKDPTAIPLAEVVPESSSVSESLRETADNLLAHRLDETVEQKVAALASDIEAGLGENSRFLTGNPFLYELGRLEGGWRLLGDKLSFWNRLLTRRATEFAGVVEHLDQRGKTWEETLKLANSSGAPPELLQRIQEVISLINQAHQEAERQLGLVLTLQSRVAEQDARVNAARASLEQTRRETIDHLLDRDSPSLWSVIVNPAEAKNLAVASSTSFRRQLTALRLYAKRNGVAFLEHALMIALSLGLLYWERPKVRKWILDEPSFERMAPIFNVPIATAVVFSYLPSRWIYPLAPQLLVAVLGAGSMLATIIVLRGLVDRRLYPILNALLAFYLLEQLRALAASLPLLSRCLFLVQTIAGIVFVIWLIRSARSPGVEKGFTERSWKKVRFYARIALVCFSAALAANALGYVALANLLDQAIMGAAYVAFVLYAFMRITEGLLFGILKVRPLTLLGVVRAHRPLLERRGVRGLRGAALILWLGYTLEILALRQPLLEKTVEFLNADLHLGSLHFTLANLLTFGLTVWAAFLLSRFLRFVLEEDVYKRLQLQRGLPYAISTLLHYSILLAGFFVAAAALGLDMTKFTILAGAFTVGVGFGLQNIINNFVSGLILLFERPVKVADVIQVGDASGVVQRIGIRAIVLRAPDGSEMIVPNGNLISNRVTNWTFSDSQRLIEVAVPVGQTADPDQVLRLLKSVAAAHPEVSKNPPPQALVINLGPGSLSLELHAWTDRAEDWMQIRSELAIAIKSVLAKENIAIS